MQNIKQHARQAIDAHRERKRLAEIERERRERVMRIKTRVIERANARKAEK